MNRGSARRWWPIWTICFEALALATTLSQSAGVRHIGFSP